MAKGKKSEKSSHIENGREMRSGKKLWQKAAAFGTSVVVGSWNLVENTRKAKGFFEKISVLLLVVCREQR